PCVMSWGCTYGAGLSGTTGPPGTHLPLESLTIVLPVVAPSAPGYRPKYVSKVRFSFTRKITCLIGLPGPTTPGLDEVAEDDGPELLEGEAARRCPGAVVPPAGQNCQIAKIPTTTARVANPRRRAICRLVGRRRLVEAGRMIGPGRCCIARSLAPASCAREGVGEQRLHTPLEVRGRGVAGEVHELAGVGAQVVELLGPAGGANEDGVLRSDPAPRR